MKQKLNCRKLTRGRVSNVQYVRSEPEFTLVGEYITKKGHTKNRYKRNPNSVVIKQIKL
ncbi:MAG: hypothetical protein H8E98_04520 [Bacteroidetes bacterium]|nr:hypothetical protein [Bacteroidota bacterium]